MELEAVSSDLQALINLYRLLQISGDSLLSATSANLDVKAKLHLKNLLHRATEKFSQPPSKIITAPSTVTNNSCSTSCDKSETTTMLQPFALQDIFKNSPFIKTRSIRDFNYPTIVLPKSENSPEKPMFEGNFLEQSKNSILSTKSESLKKRCRFCQQNSIKQQNLKGGSNTSNDNAQSVKGLEGKKDLLDLVENMDRLGQITNLTGVLNPSTDLSLTEEIDKKLEVVDYLSEEVSEAIKRIKSRFQALRPLAEVVDSLKESNAEDIGSVKKYNSLSIADKVQEPVEAKEEMVIGNEPGETQGDSNFVKTDLPSYKINRKPNHYHPRNVKAFVGKFEPLSPLKSENDNLPSQSGKYVCGLRVSPSRAKLGQEPNILTKIPSQVIEENTGHGPIVNKKTENLDCTNIVGGIRKPQTMKPSFKMNQTKAIGLKPKNNMPHPAIMWPTLLDCKSSEITVQPSLYYERKTSGTHKNITSEQAHSKIRRNQLSEETSISSSESSSSWTSQQTSPRGSESESVSGSHFSGSESRRLGSVSSYSSVSVESSSTSYSRESSFRDHPKKEFKRELRIKTGKQTGRLRRLKNKLGLVFHHHHHHHHHHNNDHAEAAHAMSLWTNMRKMFHHSSKNKRKGYDDYDDQSVKNLKKKAMVRDVQNSKNQNGHFHALVEGLMRHVRNPKKTKPSKGGIGKLGKGHNKKAVKKLHWWQILKRERGMKMPNKGRVKIGYTNKKTQSRAPKMR